MKRTVIRSLADMDEAEEDAERDVAIGGERNDDEEDVGPVASGCPR